ncbi:MAG: RNA pyrophosphohydrolase [Pseudomonadota bacterium]|nr:RNA pyrophosphohydrolase [Gammaproteobacteria bacterium]MBU1926845.1 RNA pyrophosphohydrolase [Gammaproteobacteria bacterium]MBU2546158.1 RNA pyrophosphohydrolase [Gammaproteobacteria bacterium]
MIDRRGFRVGIGIVIIDDSQRVFWARRIRRNAWQFPQGGVDLHESPQEAMYRELYEEVGLTQEDVELISHSDRWWYYRLPKHLIRYHSEPLCIGQRQKWFLLRFKGDEKKVCFDKTNTPEFDGYRWVDYWLPTQKIVFFKRNVYRKVLNEFAPLVFPADEESSIC